MPRQPILDLDTIDLDHVEYDLDAIRKVNRQRFEMEHLTAIAHMDVENRLIVACKDITDEEFWFRGHIPGRPLMPGVIMCEAVAQAASFLIHHVSEEALEFVGFGGMDKVRFRGTVVPGDRFVIIGHITSMRPRLAILEAQAFVDGKMVFEGTILGVHV
ncbi:beta-hydroxyacyl-ACP dehydratase [bacterium]|nr:beta-hydroxyacyl-ACP dehydratase [bacterium]